MESNIVDLFQETKPVTEYDLCAELQIIYNLSKHHADGFLSDFIHLRLMDAKEAYKASTGREFK
jgi:hypothetical protein